MTLTSGHLGQSGFIRWRSNKTSHTIVVHKSKGVFRDLHSISGIIIIVCIDSEDNSVWFRTKQNTLKSAITLHGVGIHSGSKSRVTLSPAPEDHGIQMEYQGVRFPVIHNYVSGTALATKITSPDQLVTIQTVEHLMAALWGSGVDNALIKLESENNDSTVEVPIMDGSALPFCRAVQDVGIQQQTKPRKVIKVKKHVEVVDGPKKSLLAPSVGLSVAALIDFQSSLIGKQLYNFDPTILSFQRDIAPARTFVVVDSEEAAESLKTIFKGGSLDNALVFTKTKLVGNPTLRFDNEPARHKILDVIGDLALTRYNLLGSYMGICPGHRLNQLLLSKLFEDSDNYQVMDAEEALKEQSVI